jgi:hypothetical protein
MLYSAAVSITQSTSAITATGTLITGSGDAADATSVESGSTNSLPQATPPTSAADTTAQTITLMTISSKISASTTTEVTTMVNQPREAGQLKVSMGGVEESTGQAQLPVYRWRHGPR